MVWLGRYWDSQVFLWKLGVLCGYYFIKIPLNLFFFFAFQHWQKFQRLYWYRCVLWLFYEYLMTILLSVNLNPHLPRSRFLTKLHLIILKQLTRIHQSLLHPTKGMKTWMKTISSASEKITLKTSTIEFLCLSASFKPNWICFHRSQWMIMVWMTCSSYLLIHRLQWTAFSTRLFKNLAVSWTYRWLGNLTVENARSLSDHQALVKLARFETNEELQGILPWRLPVHMPLARATVLMCILRCAEVDLTRCSQGYPNLAILSTLQIHTYLLAHANASQSANLPRTVFLWKT